MVFAVNTDIERWPALTPTVTSVERLETGPLRVGSQARIKQPGQRPAVWTVDTHEPDHRFGWSTKVMGIHLTATHLVDPIPTGTRNTLRLDVSGVGARMLGRLLRGKMLAVLATENEGFRREAERQAADGRPGHTPVM